MPHNMILSLFLLLPFVFSKPTRDRGREDALSENQLDFDVINNNVRVNGMPLFQGDIVMEEGMVAQILVSDIVSSREKSKIYRLWLASHKKEQTTSRSRSPRAAVKSKYRIWGEEGVLQTVELGDGDKVSSYGVVPYSFAPNIADWKKTLILEAMEHWESNTRYNNTAEYCVKFVQRESQDNYVNFVYTDGCWSKVGKSTSPEAQNISLGPRCGAMGLIAHEIGHALGFFHEQSRPDRDQWIKIITENVRPRRTHNFIKYTEYLVDPRNVQYDYASIMHYRLDAFSKNGNDTIKTLHSVDESVTIGQRDHVSRKDVEQIRRMYGCVPPEGSTEKAVDIPTTTPALAALIVATEPKGKWSWDYRNGKWVWNTT